MATKIKVRPETKLILIAGPSSSGKTTFAKRLQVQLESFGIKPEVLSVDSFYKAWTDITPDGPQKVDWESLDSLNLDQLNEVLLTLLEGKKALIPEYDVKTSTPMDRAHWTPMQLNPRGRGVIIMEGIHCLNPALTAAVPREHKFQIAIAPIPALQLDATHVLSGTTIRMLRRMVRDYLNRGRPVLATLRQWPSIAAGEVNNIYPHQGNADAVMNSEIGYEMCVLKVHVEPLLKTVPATAPEYSEVLRLLATLEQFMALPAGTIPQQSLIREFVGGSWYYDYGGWYKGY
jgi:uridine kinase